MGEPHPHPEHLWRNPEPRRAYDVVIVGAGGHGLATAYYLAKNHGITNVAVLERGWLAGGNVARNTTVIRSNYLWDESAAIYEHSLKLWEGLSEELDYDILFSQRGVLNLVHSLGDMRESRRRVNANRLNGIDAEWLTPDEVKAFCPIVNTSPDVRYPVMGAGIDPYNSYAQRGSPHVIEYQLAAAIELFPIFSRAHVVRTWAGIVDVSPDASPILGLTPVDNLFINCGWGTGGFKATPGAGWVYAHTIAQGQPHALNAPFALERFVSGALIDEHGAAAVAH